MILIILKPIHTKKNKIQEIKDDYHLSYYAIYVEKSLLTVIDLLLKYAQSTPNHRRAILQAKVIAVDTDSKTILHYAAAHHTSSVVKKILQFSPKKLSRIGDHKMNTPLHIACERISVTQTLCALDVFHALASKFYHTLRNEEELSPASSLNPIDIRLKLISKYAALKLKKKASNLDREYDDEDEFFSSSSDGEISPVLKFFGKILQRNKSTQN